MRRCARCLMPHTRPDTSFEDDICSACIAYDRRKEIDWGKRKQDLVELFEKNPGHEYDCIVPSSGGKDSHYIALTLIDLGFKPLCLTATTCHLTPIGRRNLDNLARYADTIEITPDKTVRAKLNRLALKMVGDISWPEHVLIHTLPFYYAIRLNIPLVFYGENPLNQYGGPSKQRQNETGMTRQWVAEFGGFLGIRPVDWIGIEGITEKDMRPYAPLMNPEDLDKIKVSFLGQYIPWDSYRNADVAIARGFETQLPCNANWWPFENLDNAQTGLHDYGMWLKYGYGRACAQLSVDIRTGRVERDSALKALRKREGIFPESYAGVPLSVVLEPLGLTRADVRKILDEFTNWEIFSEAI